MKNLRIFVLLAVALLVVVPSGAQDDEMVDLPPAIDFLTQAFSGDFEDFENYIHPEWQWYGNGELQFEGLEGFQAAMTFWTTVFPDLEAEVIDAVGDGDHWAAGYVLIGTHTADFPPMDIVATGNELEMYGNGFMYLEDGLLKECIWTWDWLVWYETLGIPYCPVAEEEEG